jgi:hypothetical protein
MGISVIFVDALMILNLAELGEEFGEGLVSGATIQYNRVE